MTARNERKAPYPHPLAEHVLALVLLDYSRTQIADELDLNPATVRRIIRQECEQRGTNVAGLRERARLDEEGAAA